MKRFTVSYSDDGKTWVTYQTDELPVWPRHAFTDVALNHVVSADALSEALDDECREW